MTSPRRILAGVLVIVSILGAWLYFRTRSGESAMRPEPMTVGSAVQATIDETASGGIPSAKSLPPELSAFHSWMEDYLAADPSQRDPMITRGAELAKARRPAMKEMIRTNPEAALACTPTPRERADLPPAILGHLEHPVSGAGFFGVLAVCHEDHVCSNHIRREAVLHGRRYGAHVHGRRLRMKTQENASLSGVALDDDLALHEDAFVIRTAEEMPPGMVPPGGYAVEFMGETVALADEPALEEFLREKSIAPDLPVAASGPAFDPESPPTGPAPPTAAYNEYTGPRSWEKGPKTVFVFLIEASDGPAWTNPPSLATLENQLNTASQNYYNTSYRQTWFGPKYRNPGAGNEVLVPRLVVSPVFRLNKTAASLMDSIWTQANDAKTLVEALGGEYTNNGPKDPDHFDRWVVMSNTKLVSSTGLAYVGGKISWTGGALSGSVAEHELGHNWGVVHANAWNVPQGAHPRSSSGSSEEYKDGWDLMGGGDMSTGFNTLFKEDLGFLERSRGEVLDVTTSGTYRLYDYIDPYARNATSNVRSLLLPMSGFTDSKRVFLGFGHVAGTDGGSTRSDWNRNAITVHSGLSDGSNRIDTTPFSRQVNDANDSSIKIGRTYTENATVNGSQIYGGFSVTPVQRGSTVVGGNTHEWMDVVVNYGTPSANPPVASFTQTIYHATPAVPLALSVNATDPDGDALAYDWDFGDGSYSITNTATQSKTWSAAGFYLVTCTVSDMNGRTTAASCWVNVGSLASRAPENPVSTLTGLNYRYYEGSFATMPDFSTLLPVKTGTVGTFDLSPRNRNDNFAFLFDGYLQVPANDIYTFNVTSDDGSRLYIGNTLVVDNSAVQAAAFSKSGNIALDAGKHRIRVEFFHKDGAESLSVAWSTLTSANAPISSAYLSQPDPAAGSAPVVSITQPLDDGEFIVNSDILLQAEATDADGIASVVFFADGSYLGTDTSAPYSYPWPKVSVGTRSIVALAYDNTGRWTQSSPVAIHVISPAPQPSIGLNMNTENVSDGSMFFNDVSGAVYPQANWNNLVGISGSAGTVKDYLGNNVNMPVSWVGTANTNYGDGSGNADTSTATGRMFKALAEIRHDEAQRPSITASNVPYPQYDIYVYFDLRGSDAKDTLPQRFILTPTEGAAPPNLYGKNSLSSSDAVGDYPVYDTWVGFKESTATTPTASNDALLGNYVVFRNIRAQGFTMTVDRQASGAQQRLGFNAVQIVRSDASAPLVSIRQSDGTTAVTEGGNGDSYTVVLGYAPDSNVTITPEGGTQLAVTPASLTFTPGNWNIPQAVSVAAIRDTIVEGAHPAVITHTLSASGNYQGISVPPVSVSITDDDKPTVTVRAVGSPVEAASAVSGSFHFARSEADSFTSPLTVFFQMSGTAALDGEYLLSGASVSHDSGTGLGSITIPAGQAQAFLTLTPVSDVTKEAVESAILTLTTSPAYTTGNPGSATLSISDSSVIDYLTEFFGDAATGSRTWDLNGVSLTFDPPVGNPPASGTSNYYTVSRASVSAFPSGTSGFTAYNESAMTSGSSDDGWWSQSLASPFPFFGTNQSTAYVGTNGYLTFASGDAGYTPSLSSHFTANRPRIAAFYRDLNPGSSGDVRYRRITDAAGNRSVFWYDAVNNYSSGVVSAQVELFDSGRIRMTWLNSAVPSAIVGLSSGVAATMPSSPYNGTGANPYFMSDLSSYGATGSANTPPSFASKPLTLASVGQPLAHAVLCTDPENHPLSITAPTKPSWLVFTDHGNGTATLTGTPTTAGSFPVLLQAGDGTASVQQASVLTVIPETGNTAPHFTGTPVTAASAGASYSSTITASDADGHSLSFAATEIPSWLTFTDHGNGTATLAGTAPDTGVQIHPVTLTVTDGLTTTAQGFTILLNRAPVITLTSPASGFVELPSRELTLRLESSIADESGTSCVWSLVSGPGPVMIDSPTQASTAVTFTAAGAHILRLTASDGTASASRDVHVFVESDGDAVAADGQQGWWKFDEGTGSTAADSSGNNRTLTLTSATMGGDGYTGKAYTGDASATQSAENTTFAAPTLISLSAWIWASASPSNNDRHIFNFHSGNNSRLRLYLANGTSRLRFFSDRSTDGLWEAQANVPAQEWLHVAVTYDTSSASADPLIYINGHSVAVTEIGSAPSGAQVASSAFRVGGNNSTSNAWRGRIDEVRVHNRIVPASEISLLALPHPVNAAPMVHAGTAADTAVGVPFALSGVVSDDGAPNPPAALTLLWERASGPGNAAFSNPSDAGSTVTFDAPGPHLLRLHADDGDVRVFHPVSISSTASGPSYASWIASYPGVGVFNGTHDDPDSDGLDNLVEYALALDPTIASLTGAPSVTIATDPGSGAKHLQITYRQRRGGTGTTGVNYTAGGVTYAVEVDQTLQGGSWTTMSGGQPLVEPTAAPTDNGDGTDTVTVRSKTPLAEASRQFLRLRISD